MSKPNILFICGSLNQTTIMHKISTFFNEYNCFFTPYYADGYIDFLTRKDFLNFTVLGDKIRKNTMTYLLKNNLNIDYRGKLNNYDLVFACQDLVVPDNIKDKKVILVQEGMTDPENIFYYMVKYLKLPRWIASTASTGLSHSYTYFCVASEGYKEHFIKKGVDPAKIIITGIPNFDDAEKYLNNDFPHKNYVMVATSDARETFKYENRAKFIKKALRIADGRKLLFKFHPNENFDRAIKEVEKYAPGSLLYVSGNTNHMIANCDALITKYSSVIYIGLALGKEVYSDFKLDVLKKLMPIQNQGGSAQKIAEIGKYVLSSHDKIPEESVQNVLYKDVLKN